MADPRNVAHDKRVMEEKKHDGEDLHDGTIHVPQPGMKPPLEKHEDEATEEKQSDANESA